MNYKQKYIKYKKKYTSVKNMMGGNNIKKELLDLLKKKEIIINFDVYKSSDFRPNGGFQILLGEENEYYIFVSINDDYDKNIIELLTKHKKIIKGMTEYGYVVYYIKFKDKKDIFEYIEKIIKNIFNVSWNNIKLSYFNIGFKIEDAIKENVKIYKKFTKKS